MLNKTFLLFVIMLFSYENSIITSANTERKNNINGISLTASSDRLEQEHITSVLSTNANYITLMPFGFLNNKASSKINYNTNWQWFGETSLGIKQYAKKIKETNTKLMLKPQLWVGGGTYTGFIEMTSEEDWKQLEVSYKKFILEFVKIANDLDISIFCIGTELEKFVVNRPNFWKQLITEIRNLYKGKLTYAANWDEFKRTPFWNMVDFIGIDAYFPLSDKKSPSVADLELAWQPHKKEIMRIQQQYNKNVLFTEFGYRSVDFMAKEPWNSNQIQNQVNLNNQINGLQALHNQFFKENWFSGGFLWKWFLDHNNSGGINNNRFTPQNKPTEQLIKQLYAK